MAKTFFKSILSILLIFSLFFACASCVLLPKGITIIDAKIAAGLDKKFMPVNIAEVFPAQTQKVICWFKWKDAKINTEITAKWRYLTSDVQVLSHIFNIPKIAGAGGVVLSMPNNKTLPSGLYEVSLIFGKRTIKSLRFRIE